jgi:hypothetical protein
MPLDIIKTVQELSTMYENGNSKYVRVLLFGDIGTGKTRFLSTAPMPAHIDSFDKGGTKTLRNMGLLAPNGPIVADASFEDEDPRHPSVLEKFDKAYVERKKNGYFEYFSTYMLDGMTMLFQAALNKRLALKGRKDGIPEVGKGKDNDYVGAQALVEPLLKDILNLPCHVIINAHADLSTDEVTDKAFIGPKISGGMQARMMAVTDEIWCLQRVSDAKGDAYRVLTKPTGRYRCRSRMAANGKIDTYEDPDFKGMLIKGDYAAGDKAIPWMNK